MWRDAFALALLACGMAAGQAAKPGGDKPFIEDDSGELLRAVPQLAGTQFDSNQDGLDALLKASGENLSAMFDKLVDISAAEQIHELRFETNMARISRRENFRYVVKWVSNGAQEQFTEVRVDPVTGASARPPDGDFLVTGHFFNLLRYLAPENQERSRFRYLGRSTAAGADFFVVAFAQRPESTDGRAAPLQGIVWLDAATHRMVRLRTDLLRRIAGSPFDTLTTDISLAAVSFPSPGRTFWLPATVTVHARYAGGELDSVHRYADYRLYGAGASDSQQGKDAAIAAATAPTAENAWELLDRGISLAEDNKPGEALSVLHEALRLNPEMAAGHYHLAAAMRATSDFAGAEAELREAVKLAPDSGPVHNLLGILLFQRGDMADALTELRLAVQLQPKDATVHYNLAQGLEKTGDRKGALEEYQAASNVAPGNAKIKARYEQLERAASTPPAAAATPTAAAPGETTIKVEVRQVLVPVVVRDKEGHHVTGLTQADFRVFEDGVEQKISGFSVENAGVPSPPPPAVAASPPASPQASPQAGAAEPAAVTPQQVPVRRTYLICIDALHTEFGHLVYIREALSKLFHSERAGDAEYVVISVGASMQVLQQPTRDPASVLKVVDSKDFQKLFLASRKSSTEDDLRSFRRSLDEARAACDAGDPSCPGLKRRLPSEASEIAELDRLYTRAFLSQFRSLIEQLRRAAGRRTVILFSDGFQLVPGQLAYQLLSAYFPEFRSAALRTVDRMPDMEPVLQLAANSNIPVYTIDSRGLYTSPFFDAASPGSVARMAPAAMSAIDGNAMEAGQTLSEIAAATGGTAFRNSNDLLNGLQRAFADGREYYMLAYVSGNSNPDGKFRAISVRMRDSKLVVNAKRGYWATGTSN
jgi:VWFA-related protein